MKRIGVFFVMVGLLVLLLPHDSLGQQGLNWKGSGGWGSGTPYGRMFDPKTVETIKGEVTRVDQIVPMRA